MKVLLQPLTAHPRNDTTISALIQGSAAYAELLECDALEEFMTAASRTLYCVFVIFLPHVGSHKILHVHRWWASFVAAATATSNPTDAQVDSLVRALLQCFQELDAVGELFPPSVLARALSPRVPSALRSLRASTLSQRSPTAFIARWLLTNCNLI